MQPFRRILHVDMDAFYAAVEAHDRPELRGVPLIVAGSEQGRGVVMTASYEARRYGVRSAMPTARALRLCPTVVRVDPRPQRYREVSRQIHDVFAEYTDSIEPLSLDESFLDLSAYCARERQSVGSVAARIKADIRERTGLVASAGAGPNKFVAKVASDLRKPDGLVVVAPDQVVAFLRPLPLERIWGVGPVTARRLHALGLRTIGDLADRPAEWLEAELGRSGRLFHELAHGMDDRPVVCDHEPRSLSAEETFAHDITSLEAALQQMQLQAEEVSRRLRGHRCRGRTITLKLRYADFTTISRSCSGTLTDSAEQIYEVARTLLARTEFPTRPIRLVGVGVHGLVDDERPLQLELF